MGWIGGWGRAAGVVALVVLAVPALGLVPAAFLDRGPGGEVRLSSLPIALAMLDPFVWQCARNSSAVAGVVALGSAAVGVGLGVILGRRRFWGRPLLAALALAPLAAGVLLIAPGVAQLVGGADSLDWLAARSLLGWSCEDLARWAGLAWVGLACGVPLVILATTSALARVEAAWADAARAHGASGWRIWLDLTWPVIRPDVARTAAAVFALTLVEPVGPTALGLRRTLAAQMLEAARTLDDPTRAATLALISVAIACLGRALILRAAGPPCLVAGHGHGPMGPSPPSGRWGSLGSVAILSAWAAFALGPAASTLGRGLRGGRRVGRPGLGLAGGGLAGRPGGAGLGVELCGDGGPGSGAGPGDPGGVHGDGGGIGRSAGSSGASGRSRRRRSRSGRWRRRGWSRPWRIPRAMADGSTPWRWS